MAQPTRSPTSKAVNIRTCVWRNEVRRRRQPLFVKRPTSVQDSSAAPGAAVARRSATMSKRGFTCGGCHAPSALTSSAT